MKVDWSVSATGNSQKTKGLARDNLCVWGVLLECVCAQQWCKLVFPFKHLHCCSMKVSVVLTSFNFCPAIDPDLSMTATKSMGARLFSSSWHGALRVTRVQISSALSNWYCLNSHSQLILISLSSAIFEKEKKYQNKYS